MFSDSEIDEPIRGTLQGCTFSAASIANDPAIDFR